MQGDSQFDKNLRVHAEVGLPCCELAMRENQDTLVRDIGYAASKPNEVGIERLPSWHREDYVILKLRKAVVV